MVFELWQEYAMGAFIFENSVKQERKCFHKEYLTDKYELNFRFENSRTRSFSDYMGKNSNRKIFQF